MMDFLSQFFSDFSGWLWGYPMLILLIGTHVFLTIRTRFIQRYLGTALKMYTEKGSKEHGDISQFSSLCVSLAACIGTGNIVGVGTAVALGGPGAVFWCWITGILGMATKYGEGLLSVKYRMRTENGRMIGGPMFVLARGLKLPWLAVAFSLFTIMASFGIGNLVQGNAAATLVKETLDIDQVWTGLFLAALVGVVVLGGIKSIGRACAYMVPIMAIFYILGCLYILVLHHVYVWSALVSIVVLAFDPTALAGGAVGATIMTVMRYGVARGLFSNEAGMGSAPIASAAAQTRNSVRQALISASGVFWDTVVVCALTGLVIVSSMMADEKIASSEGGLLTQRAFAQIPYVGEIVLTVALLTFAISTVIGWAYYGEKSVEYLFGSRVLKAYRLIWIVVAFVGAVVKSELVWNFSDCANALMAIPNLIALICLSGVIVMETRKYLWNNRLDEIDTTPVPLFIRRQKK